MACVRKVTLSVPHYRFGCGDRVFWVDAHFPAFLDNRFRASALIRSEVSPRAAGIKVGTAFSPEEVIQFFEDLAAEVEKEIRRIGAERAREMGRWSLARILLIPKGLFRKISTDERLVRKEGELRLSLEIARKVLESRYLGEVGYLNVRVENSVPEDPVYSELMKVDESFKKRFMELIQ